MEDAISKQLAHLIQQHADKENPETIISSLFLYNQTQQSEPGYRIYKPSFCVIAQGSKEVLLAKEQFKYGSANYLINSTHLPVIGKIIKATNTTPYLSLKLEFTPEQILDVINESNIKLVQYEHAKRALFVGNTDSSLMDIVLRLVRLLDTPNDIPYLSPLVIKELLYKLLQGPYGVTLSQIAMQGSITYRIRGVIDFIMKEYHRSWHVEELAEIAHMSVSNFHRNFKEVTAMTPIQFQKDIRLQEARRILLTELAEAADVAYRVGYESASQFSREYTEMFGYPPRKDVKLWIEKYNH